MESSAIWLEEYGGNPSIVGLAFQGPDDSDTVIGLTREGAVATIELLTDWLDYHDEAMDQLFSDLTQLEGTE